MYCGMDIGVQIWSTVMNLEFYWELLSILLRTWLIISLKNTKLGFDVSKSMFRIVCSNEFENQLTHLTFVDFECPSLDNCNYNGRCSSNTTCDCFEGYSGNNCSNCMLSVIRMNILMISWIDECSGNCNSHGTCMNTFPPTCSCNNGW